MQQVARADLTSATVVGFFSLPSPSLAEANPSAYSAAMRNAPAGAGCCGYCGTGILHHVVIKLVDGTQAFIGSDCAMKVGEEFVRRCVRERRTAEQIAAGDAERERKASERQAANDVLVAQVAAERAARYETLKDVIDALRAQTTSFHNSLADQLLDGSLSDRQAIYACKAVLGVSRYSKRVAAQWDAIYERVTNTSIAA